MVILTVPTPKEDEMRCHRQNILAHSMHALYFPLFIREESLGQVIHSFNKHFLCTTMPRGTLQGTGAAERNKTESPAAWRGRTCVADMRLLNKSQLTHLPGHREDWTLCPRGVLGATWSVQANELWMEVPCVTWTLNSQGRICLSCPCQGDRRGSLGKPRLLSDTQLGLAQDEVSETWVVCYWSIHQPQLTDTLCKPTHCIATCIRATV